MTTNTEGRLTAQQSPISTASLLHMDGEYIAKIEEEAEGLEGVMSAPEFAARLAASYNACRSVPLDVLERIDFGRLLEAARKIHNGSASLSERDAATREFLAELWGNDR